MPLIRTSAAVVAALSLASSAAARTDLAGCTYTDLVVKPTQMAAYASRLWYVPDTGEVCAFLDCGGGRAPPKSTVPGCPLYTGTETYAPSYIDPKTLGNGVVEAGSSVAAATTAVLATPSETASESAASATASASESASPAAATTASATTTDASITILTGTNTSTPSKSAESSSAQATSAASTAGASSPSSSSGSSKTVASGSSSSGAATTTSPSSAAGAMQTVGAVLGPCVVAAMAAGLA
ncbi:hypothetical protein G3M48_001215 [Beauveria asiatica]|uniref:Siderophore biosynthesis enzyme n=1 Tax=Beauveria asiatica TaxID=1069075 RepID=A0AAW0RFM7_9HYPO